ncbi:UNVERIFIED_ORG: hypothetical protein ABIB63_000519 [Xanthomonas axonopodis]
MDALLLSRIQFGFVIAFHVLFPAFTIGLSSLLAFLEWRWLRTRLPVWRELYFFWQKIFAVSFGMGVVSGIVMAFQFGANWPELSRVAGGVIGPLLSYEVLTAFFLEASFLGVMMFGWGRISERLHFLATCMVALGTLFSTFWILSSNSWLQTPAGYEVSGGVVHPVDWLQIIFNPSFPYRLAHMALGSFNHHLLRGGCRGRVVSASWRAPPGRAAHAQAGRGVCRDCRTAADRRRRHARLEHAQASADEDCGDGSALACRKAGRGVPAGGVCVAQRAGRA